MVHLPISPDNIFLTDDGRWTWLGVDVTDHPLWWKCRVCGHDYQESLAMMTAADAGSTCCPACTGQVDSTRFCAGRTHANAPVGADRPGH